jgi:signal transduction histidine kinase
VTSRRPPRAEPRDDAALWLAAQHAVAARAAHEIKNALNGVSVNLAVVQSRLRRQQAPESVTRFADTALEQLELLTGQVESLLALVRESPEPVDVGVVARQLSAVLASSGGNGPALTVDAPDAGSARTAAPASVVRAVLAQVAEQVVDGGGGARCTVAPAADGSVRVTVRARAELRVDGPLAAAVAAAGVAAAEGDGGAVVLTFPPAPDAARP